MSYNQLRTGRHSEPGREYFITFATHNRIRVFDDFYSARILIRELRQLDKDQRLFSLAWVLMPDHLHLLGSLGAVCSLSECIRQLKGRSSRVIMRIKGRAILRCGSRGFMIKRCAATRIALI